VVVALQILESLEEVDQVLQVAQVVLILVEEEEVVHIQFPLVAVAQVDQVLL
tara:strand:+ start:606 stop:761 length:156 start_codon:yes stop_codon:yes gene_type:complete